MAWIWFAQVTRQVRIIRLRRVPTTPATPDRRDMAVGAVVDSMDVSLAGRNPFRRGVRRQGIPTADRRD